MEIQKRSHAGVMTIGVLQLVFGAIGLICGLIALSGVSESLTAGQQGGGAPGAPSQAEIQKMMQEEMPNQKVEEKVEYAVGLVLSVLMVVSGIGLVQMKNWGRQVANVYAVLSIIFRIASVIFAVIFVLPGMDRVADKLAAKTGANGATLASAMKIGAMIGLIFAAVIVIYPIIVLVVVNMASAKAALSGTSADTGAFPTDYDDRHDRGFAPEPEDRYRQPPDDRTQPM
jgi:hypothetical protein